MENEIAELRAMKPTGGLSCLGKGFIAFLGRKKGPDSFP